MEHSFWRCVKGVTMIWHGEWSDPELEHEGNVANYYDVEDSMWERYKEECELGYYEYHENDDFDFNRFCNDNAEKVYELIEVYSK